MRTKNVLVSSLSSILILAGVAVLGLVLSPAHAEETQEDQRSGEFVSVGRKSVEGKARIVNRNGLYYVRLEDGFLSDDGPDLFVYLHKQSEPKSFKRKNYTDLGRLQSVSGGQWYQIPSDVDIGEANSVVVRCRKFSVTFGFATLSKPDQASP